MEPWSARHVQELLDDGEELELAFPVRYPMGNLPFEMLLRGCVIALTDRRITAFAYNKATSKPAEPIWSEDRAAACSATLSTDGRRLKLVRSTGEKQELAVSPRYRDEIHRFIVGLAT